MYLLNNVILVSESSISPHCLLKSNYVFDIKKLGLDYDGFYPTRGILHILFEVQQLSCEVLLIHFVVLDQMLRKTRLSPLHAIHDPEKM